MKQYTKFHLRHSFLLVKEDKTSCEIYNHKALAPCHDVITRALGDRVWSKIHGLLNEANRERSHDIKKALATVATWDIKRLIALKIRHETDTLRPTEPSL